MTIEQLIEEAKERYPLECKYCLVTYGGEIASSHGIIKGSRFTEWINSSFPKEAQAITEKDSNGLVYAYEVWAPIIKYPEGFVPKQSSFIQEIY